MMDVGLTKLRLWIITAGQSWKKKRVTSNKCSFVKFWPNESLAYYQSSEENISTFYYMLNILPICLQVSGYLSINWPPLTDLNNVAAVDQSEHGGSGRHGCSFIRLCVSLQCVSCSPCHRWWQSSMCDWFWTERRADILSSRCKPGTHSAQCPKAGPGAVWHLTHKVNLYVGAAPCLSTSAVAVPLFILISV